MNFSRYCRNLDRNLKGVSSQSRLIGALFNKAGSTFFPEIPVYGTDSYQRKLFSGDKPFTQEMKNSFPNPIDSEKLSIFFNERIGDKSLLKIMANFGIQTNEAQIKTHFITALCNQFQLIVSDASDEVNDIVLIEYSKLLDNEAGETEGMPKYPGDDFIANGKEHSTFFYEEFEHVWTLKNTGSVAWKGRKIVCIEWATLKSTPRNAEIEIPNVAPGGEVMISVMIDSRAIESVHKMIWIIVDASGDNCFPNSSGLEIIVSVSNPKLETLKQHDVKVIEHIKSVMENPYLRHYLIDREQTSLHRDTIYTLFNLYDWCIISSNKCVSGILAQHIERMVALIDVYHALVSMTFFKHRIGDDEYLSLLDNKDRIINFIEADKDEYHKERLDKMYSCLEQIQNTFTNLMACYNSMKS